MTPFTIAEAVALASSGFAAWLMVGAARGKKMLSVKTVERCASCGRLRDRRRCPCRS